MLEVDNGPNQQGQGWKGELHEVAQAGGEQRGDASGEAEYQAPGNDNMRDAETQRSD